VSQTDSFIDEVTEEVRRDRLFGLVRKYGWIAVLAVVLVVGAAGVVEWRKAQAQAQARALGDAVFAALESQQPSSRAVALGEIAADGAAAAVVALLQAGELAAAGQAAEAAEMLESVAADPDIPEIYRDTAILRLTMVPDLPMMSEQKLARLEPLTAPGAPLRPLALEQMALLRMERGESDMARDLLRGLLEDAETSPAQRERVRQLLIVIGGGSEGA